MNVSWSAHQLARAGDRRTSPGPPGCMARRAPLIDVLPGYLWLVLYQFQVCQYGLPD